MSDERLRLTADMRDRLSPALRRLKTVMESTGRIDAFRKLAVDMSRAERAGYRLAFGLQRGVAIAGHAAAIGVAAAGAAALGAGAAMVKFGKDSADAMDDQAAFAKQIGFSGDTLRTLEGVAKRYNVEQDSLRNGLQKFSVTFGQLKSGQGAFLGYLQKTNPALAAQMRHVGSTEEAYLLLFDAMSKIADPAKRAAFAKAAGIGQQSLRFLADGPDDLRETIKQVKALQGVIGPKAFEDAANYGDAMDNIGLAWQGLRDRLTAAALPTVVPMLQDLADFMVKNRAEIASGFQDITRDAAGGLRELAKWFGSLTKEDYQKVWSGLKDGARAIGDIAVSIKDLAMVVNEMGGWKAVIGLLVGYKLMGGAPSIIGGLAGLAAGGGGAAAGGIAAGAAAVGGSGLGGILGPVAALIGAGSAIVLALRGSVPGRSPTTGQWTGGEAAPGMARPGDAPDNGRVYPEDRTARWRPGDIAAEASASREELQRRLDAQQLLQKRMDYEAKQWLASDRSTSDPVGYGAFVKHGAEVARSITALQKRMTRLGDGGSGWLGRVRNVLGIGGDGADGRGSQRAALDEARAVHGTPLKQLQRKAADLRVSARLLDEKTQRWIEKGRDKTDPATFAAIQLKRASVWRQIQAIEQRIARTLTDQAPEIGKAIGRRIGEEAGDALYKRMQFLLSSPFAGGGSGGGGVIQASYRPGGRVASLQSFIGKGSMLDLIAAAEGTGKNYNATLGYDRFTGGPVDLTRMTLDQIDALQGRMLRHPGNRWNSSALGRYQFVRTRLRDLRRRYGIPGSAIFSPALQDALANLSLSERGHSVGSLRSEWQGLSRVPAGVLRDAIRRREQRRAPSAAPKLEGAASVDVRFLNAPAGTRVAARSSGLFRPVNLDVGRTMQPASA